MKCAYIILYLDNSRGRSDLDINTGKIASSRSGPYLWYNNITISG